MAKGILQLIDESTIHHVSSYIHTVCAILVASLTYTHKPESTLNLIEDTDALLRYICLPFH